MRESIKQYKDLCEDILKILQKNTDINNDKLDKCFEERQIIIDKLDKENKIDEFRKIYKEELLMIDEKIKEKLQYNIDSVKEEIKHQKKNTNVNFTYVNMSKNKMNIFSKKV